MAEDCTRLAIADLFKVLDSCTVAGYETNSPQFVEPFNSGKPFYLREQSSVEDWYEIIRSSPGYVALKDEYKEVGVRADSTAQSVVMILAIPEAFATLPFGFASVILRSDSNSISYWSKLDSASVHTVPVDQALGAIADSVISMNPQSRVEYGSGGRDRTLISYIHDGEAHSFVKLHVYRYDIMGPFGFQMSNEQLRERRYVDSLVWGMFRVMTKDDPAMVRYWGMRSALKKSLDTYSR